MRRIFALLVGLSLLSVVAYASPCVTLQDDVEGGCFGSTCHFICARELRISQAPLMPGYETGQYGRKTVVEAVYRGSPAKTAGLRRGDVILSIDGKPLSEASSVWQVAGLHTLLIDRNGKRYTKLLQAVPYEGIVMGLYTSGPRIRDISAIHQRRFRMMPFLSGLLVQQHGRELLVTAVASGSPAEKVGLRLGDILASPLIASQLEAAQFRRTVNLQVLSPTGTRRVTFTYVGVSEILDANAE